MNRSDISDLIAMARAFDDRVEEVRPPYRDPSTGAMIEDARIAAWHMILGDIDLGLAQQGLVELYQEPQIIRLQPGHIYQAAERVRRRNVASVDLEQLVPPDELATEAGERSRMPAWRQAAIGYIGRGFPVSEAQRMADDDLRVSRRQLGPASPGPRRLAATVAAGVAAEQARTA